MANTKTEIKTCTKLMNGVDEKLKQWERGAVLNMAAQYKNWANSELVTYPTGLKRFQVTLENGFVLECSYGGYLLLRKSYDKQARRITLKAA